MKNPIPYYHEPVHDWREVYPFVSQDNRIDGLAAITRAQWDFIERSLNLG